MKRKTGHLMAWMVRMAMCLTLFASAGSAQTIVHSFDGDQGLSLKDCNQETERCYRQPEMDASVNGRQVTQVTRQHVNVYDYSGKLLRSTSMSDFVRNAGLDPTPPVRNPQNVAQGKQGPFEPHVVFDEFIGRWIITATCLNDCLLVSASSDPLGAWGGVYLTCLQGGPCLNHDPGLKVGYDKNGVYYCGAHAGEEDPNTAPQTAWDCFALPPAEVKEIAQGKAPAHINRKHNMALDIVPAIDHNPNKAASAPAFFVAKSCGRDLPSACMRSKNLSFDWLVSTFTWNGTSGTYVAGGDEQRVKTDIGSKRNKWLYNLPCCGPDSAMPQPGTDLLLRAGNIHRRMNVVQYGSHLYAVEGSGGCSADCGEQGTDANNVMFWMDLDCSKPAACVVSQTTKISGPDINPVFGTVGVDKDGNVGIVATSFTPKTYMSVLLWTRHKNDPPNAFKGPMTVAAGTQPYTCPQNNITQLGNAVGLLTALDPQNGTTLWTNEQWANNATPCVWNTRIVGYQISGGAKASAQ